MVFFLLHFSDSGSLFFFLWGHQLLDLGPHFNLTNSIQKKHFWGSMWTWICLQRGHYSSQCTHYASNMEMKTLQKAYFQLYWGCMFLRSGRTPIRGLLWDFSYSPRKGDVGGVLWEWALWMSMEAVLLFSEGAGLGKCPTSGVPQLVCICS